MKLKFGKLGKDYYSNHTHTFYVSPAVLCHELCYYFFTVPSMLMTIWGLYYDADGILHAIIVYGYKQEVA